MNSFSLLPPPKTFLVKDLLSALACTESQRIACATLLVIMTTSRLHLDYLPAAHNCNNPARLDVSGRAHVYRSPLWLPSLCASLPSQQSVEKGVIRVAQRQTPLPQPARQCSHCHSEQRRCLTQPAGWASDCLTFDTAVRSSVQVCRLVPYCNRGRLPHLTSSLPIALHNYGMLLDGEVYWGGKE